MTIGATLIQATNMILLIANSSTDMRKFVVWQEEGNELKEVLNGLEVTEVGVEDNAQLFEHPLESGAVIVDHIIYSPNRVSITAYISIDDAATLKSIEYLFLSGAKLQIRAENKILKNMVIESKPAKISAQHFNKTLYNISFKEAQEVIPTYTSLSKAGSRSNTSRVNSGQKQAKPVKKSWLFSTIFGGRT